MAFFWRNPAVLWNFAFGWLLALGPGAGATFPGASAESVSVVARGRGAGWQWAWRLHLGFGALPLLATKPDRKFKFLSISMSSQNASYGRMFCALPGFAAHVCSNAEYS